MAFQSSNINKLQLKNKPSNSPRQCSNSGSLFGFLKTFSAFETAQVENIAKMSVQSITKSRSYFREQDVLKKVLEKSQKDLGENILERDNFERSRSSWSKN